MISQSNQIVWSTWPKLHVAMLKMSHYSKWRDPISEFSWENIGLRSMNPNTPLKGGNGWFFEVINKEKYLFAIMQYGIDEEFFYHNR